MAKNTYQTYTEDTPLGIYRTDFIRRGALCIALSKRHPALATIGAEADAVLAQIDSRRGALQEAEDAQVRARAVEDAERMDVADVYAELRLTMAAKKYDIATLLPDAPSTLGGLGAKNFGERAQTAVNNLAALPDGDGIKAAFWEHLKKELAEFRDADKAEDDTRGSLKSGRVALLLYKSELSQTRESQLGAIQTILRDREKTAQFTIPWRKYTKHVDEDTEGTTAPGPDGAGGPSGG